MFSGIIEGKGHIVSITSEGMGKRVRVSLPFDVDEAGGVGSGARNRVGLGDSIAVFGVCLTVDTIMPPHTVEFLCGRETMSKTKLGTLTVGDVVALERALSVGDRFDGHLVQGHVDGVGTLQSITYADESVILWVNTPPSLSKYIAVKGSICLDGVSLTVNEVSGDSFRINIVPYTIKETCLGELRAGDPVNLEVDVIARYVEKMLGLDKAGLSFDRMRELGYDAPYKGT